MRTRKADNREIVHIVHSKSFVRRGVPGQCKAPPRRHAFRKSTFGEPSQIEIDGESLSGTGGLAIA
jgi:hypothetical protein